MDMRGAEAFEWTEAYVDAESEAVQTGVLGNSAPMVQIYHQIRKVAATSATVLVSGETGTGKEYVARSIHEQSDRRFGPFIAVNCGAISPQLAGSELFGHERGSFTGAVGSRKGVFEQAKGGTIFLDEITETPPEVQVSLLRVLESRQLCRVGGGQPVDLDVRIVAATNRVPAAAVSAGVIRADLLHRLQVFTIELPPLRAHRQDIPLLAERFLGEFNDEYGSIKRLAPQLFEKLQAYDWPGNLRELRNVLHGAYIMADAILRPEHLAARVRHATAAPSAACLGSPLCFEPGTPLAEVERALILATLAHYQGQRAKTAQALGVSLKTLYNRLRQYESPPIL